MFYKMFLLNSSQSNLSEDMISTKHPDSHHNPRPLNEQDSKFTTDGPTQWVGLNSPLPCNEFLS